MTTSKEIEFSIMADSANNIQALLDQFEAEQHIRVRVRLLSWDTAWSELVRVALYGQGPDVSEIGSTWLGDIIAMNALRPFNEREIAALGRPEAFLPVAWRGVHPPGHVNAWAIPWFVGARLLFYRRRLLQQAGVDAGTAFQNAGQLDQALDRLQAAGVGVPWTVPTGTTHTTLLNVASWVWGAGGDFISVEGKRTLFNQPPARAGLRAYFALGRFLAPSVRHLNGLEPDQQFLQGPDTAMTLSGSWLFEQVGPELKEQLGVALPPGASFVGGSHLIVWKHTLKAESALKLIHFLTRPQAQATYSQRVGLIPAVQEAFKSPPYAGDPLWQLVIEGVRTGRSFPVVRSWGLVEDRLTKELSELWREVLHNPNPDLDALLAKRFDLLAQRLDLVLGQS
jgi:multiple sugar transport system substrate-binding protein